ncbi:MAG: J domain-containing protein [Chloroflexota bacterium]|nr:J domain-containing protein [Chloroflexota bacterium]
MSIPHIRYQPGDYRATVTFPYHPEVVQSIKDTILSYDREWNPSLKQWLVAPPWIETARRILASAFGECRVSGNQDRPEPTPIRSIDRAYRVLHLLPTAPPELIEASYRIVAKRVHPDCGGDAEAMRQLNAAIALLRDEVTA